MNQQIRKGLAVKKVIILLLGISLTSAAVADWTTDISNDVMSGELKAYAHSDLTAPLKKMSFPYSEVKSYLGVGCDKENEWAYVGFTTPPNIINDETLDGFSQFDTRVKWDEELTNMTFTQTWGSKFLHFGLDQIAIENLLSSNEVLIEINWHSMGSVHFKYSLKGSTKSINEIRAACKQ